MKRQISTVVTMKGKWTHIRLDVLVLEVERMLPDINADDGDVGWKAPVSLFVLRLRQFE